MDRYVRFVMKRKKLIVIIFAMAAALSAVILCKVKVNYNLADYLPPAAKSTKALQIMEEEFAQAIPNANVMIKDINIPEALTYKKQIQAIKGVLEVLWLDDTADIKKPIQIYDDDTVGEFYKDGKAKFSVSIKEGQESETIHAIRTLIGRQGAVSGEAADISAMRSTAASEVGKAVLILVPVILLLLCLSTTSWIEPVLFATSIGVSIIINMGTNLMWGEVSFITNAVAPILQLAVSFDYAIFLLHSFETFLKESGDPESAMRKAMKKSVRAVAASAVTTLFGFLALTFMQFQIGADLGLCLVKGILLSFISCMFFLPALIILCSKGMEKTRHRQWLPAFRSVNKGFRKLSVPFLIIVVILSVPAFLGKDRVEFTYGNEDKNTSSQNWKENQEVRETFGQSVLLALLVPKGDVVKEDELSKGILELDHVTGVVSYAAQVGNGIPVQFLDTGITKQFYSEHYARMIIYTDTESEGEEAFSTVEAVNREAGKYYGDQFYLAGQSASLYDMKQVVSRDNVQVNIIAVIAILIVLILTFRSGVLPFILLFTIETGIWINLSIPYFTDSPLHFMGYLVISTVQLGATVDYAILLTSYYLDSRKRMGQDEAIAKAMSEAFQSILLSGTTLAAAGLVLYVTSSNPIVSELGALLGRGTLLSMLMVFCLLPALLRAFDKMIGITTYKSDFYHIPVKQMNENR